jgi:hypothetical protein
VNTRSVLGVAWLASVLGWLGCGGGSPADVVLPQTVDVTLTLPETRGREHAVQLDLATVEGNVVQLDVVGLELEQITGVAFELLYEPEFLEFVGFSPGDFFGVTSVEGVRVVQASSEVLVGVAAGADQAAPRNGTGRLVALRFRLRQLRDGETQILFGFPNSTAYGVAGVAGQHSFTNATLLTRIRPPG